MAEQPSASPLRDAERAFMSYRRRCETGEDVDFEAFCREHLELEEDLRFLNSVFVEGKSVGATASFRDLLKDQMGDSAVACLAIGEDAPADFAREGAAAAAAAKRDRYVLGEEIGRGGMSRILRAWDRDLNRALAMKVQLFTGERAPPMDSVAGRRTLERFFEEAHITAQLDHPGIVPIHDVGFDTEGRVYFTMRLVKGSDFGKVIELARREEDGWNLPRVLGVFLKICETVAFAHAKGVIHRDLKPANIMVGKYGETYVMDWGLARILGGEDRHEARLRFASPETLSTVRARRSESDEVSPEDALATPAGTVVGTPVYMSPEQAAGMVEQVNQRSDVYSLGAILYGLLAGRPPYVPPDGKISPFVVLGKVVEGPPERILAINPAAPPELVAICEKAMAREAKHRHHDSLELAEELRAFLDRRVSRASSEGDAGASRSLRAKALMAVGAAVVLIGMTIGTVASRAGGQGSVEDAVLADLARLAALEREADVLWPASSENVDAFADWLERARTWAASASAHRAHAERVADTAGEALRAHLARLGDGLDAFTAPDPFRGAIASVENRLEFARGVRKNTVDDVWDRWLEVGIAPQEGLVPLRRNPESGLWEFAHSRTGQAPGPDGGDGAGMRAETGLILVLVPGPENGERFFLSKRRMTRAQWERVAGPLASDGGEPREAVTGVSWKDCHTVLGRLGLALPTVRQWRHASTHAFGLDAMLDGPREWCRDGISGRDTFVHPDDRAADVSVRPARAIDE